MSSTAQVPKRIEMRTIVLICIGFFFVQCSSDRKYVPLTIKEQENLLAFRKMDNAHKVFITKEDEPGEKLILCLLFIDKASKETIDQRQVHFYHTSTEGNYEPAIPNDDSTARLSGSAITSDSGKIYVETILPGDYGSSENNRHIHMGVKDANPEAYDIFFEQYSGGMGKLMNSWNDQIFYADLKKTKDDKLVCFVSIEVKNAIKIKKVNTD